MDLLTSSYIFTMKRASRRKSMFLLLLLSARPQMISPSPASIFIADLHHFYFSFSDLHKSIYPKPPHQLLAPHNQQCCEPSSTASNHYRPPMVSDLSGVSERQETPHYLRHTNMLEGSRCLNQKTVKALC